MTWPRYLELCEYWEIAPPLVESVAGLIGHKSGTGETLPDDAFDALMHDLGGAGVDVSL